MVSGGCVAGLRFESLEASYHRRQFPKTRPAKQSSDRDMDKRTRFGIVEYRPDDFRTRSCGHRHGAVRIQHYHDANAFLRDHGVVTSP